MKLTKQKLEQLIMETYKSYVRRPGDEGKPTNYPEYADKLSALYKNPSTRAQALSLADSLGEPIDLEYDSTEKLKRFPMPSEEFTHGSESGLRLYPGGGSSQSVIYKMHDTARKFLDFLDQNVGSHASMKFHANDRAAFYNEEWIKLFGKAYGKESEDLLRAFIKNTKYDYDDELASNREKEWEMEWGRYGK